MPLIEAIAPRTRQLLQKIPAGSAPLTNAQSLSNTYAVSAGAFVAAYTVSRSSYTGEAEIEVLDWRR